MLARRMQLFALLTFSPPALAAPPGVRVQPEPAWVSATMVADTVRVPSERVGGLYVLLSESQYNCLGPQPEVYWHRATLVLNEQGVSDVSQLSCEFDPLYQQLSFHRVVVRRRGAVLDRLVPSNIRLLQRETGLEESIYEGTRTALLLLEDVRPGDIVEASYSIRGENPVMAGHFGKTWSMGWDIPVRALRRRLLWPEARPLVIRRFGTGVEPQVARRPGVLEYTWTVENAPTVVPEKDLPSGFDPYPGVQVTDFRNWNEVARWGAPLYRLADSPSPIVRERIDALRAAGGTDEKRAIAAIHFVQDEVRYLGIELGESSHRPTSPERVLTQRFGDCKDKAILLVALLRGLGFDAHPALVRSEGGSALTALAPSPLDFDHVIACFRHGGSTYWVDATQQAERGGSLEALDVPDFGHALVLEDTTTCLTPVSPRPGARGRIVIRKDFDARQVDAPARLTVQTTYQGRDANEVRRNLHGESNEDMARRYHDYYAGLYPGVEATARPSMDDDEDANIVTVHESYAIRDFWTASVRGEKRVGRFDPLEALPSFPDLGTTPRTMPLGIGPVSHVICETHALMPRGWSAPAWSTEITSGPFRFQAHVSGRDGALVMRDDASVLQDVVPAAEAKSASDDFDTIDEALKYATYSGRNSAGPRTTGLNVWGVLVFLAAIALGVTTSRWFVRQPFAVSPPGAAPPPGASAGGSGGDPGAAPAGPARPAPSAPDEDAGPPEPPAIGGWLVVLAFGVIVQPITLVFGSASVWRVMLQSSWLAQLRYANDGAHPGHVPIVLGELAVMSIQVVWWLGIGHLFFSRRRQFPRSWVTVVAIATMVQVLDGVAVAWSSGGSLGDQATTVAGIARTMGGLAIWGSYLVRSRRVARTFIA